MATTFLLLLMAVFVPIIGLRLALLRYAPTPTARQLRSVQLGLSLQLFRDRILFLRNREMRMLYGYRKSIRELQLAVLMRKGFETYAAKHGPELERLLRQTEEYAIIERYYDRKLRQAADFWGNMSDAQLQSIATSIRDQLLEGLVPVTTVAKFLIGERDIIKTAPHMAVGHHIRMLTRMREIKAAVLAAGGGDLRSVAK